MLSSRKPVNSAFTTAPSMVAQMLPALPGAAFEATAGAGAGAGRLTHRGRGGTCSVATPSFTSIAASTVEATPGMVGATPEATVETTPTAAVAAEGAAAAAAEAGAADAAAAAEAAVASCIWVAVCNHCIPACNQTCVGGENKTSKT